jgi:hypothetical protein
MKFYIASLPRSGSTLLQNMLATDENVYTASEGWIELYFESLNSRNLETKSTYGNSGVDHYLDELTDKLGIDRAQIPQILSEALDNYIQNKISKKYGNSQSRIILDKTPRYFYIIEELLKRVDTKLIILRRHPVAVLASYEKAFCKTAYKLPLYLNDFKVGYKNIIHHRLNEDEKLIQVSYRSLVDDTVTEMKKIEKMLNVNIDLKKLSFSKRTGRLGDPHYGDKSKIVRRKSVCISLAGFLFMKLFLRDIVTKYDVSFPDDKEEYVIRPIVRDFINIPSLLFFYIAWIFNFKVIQNGFSKEKGRLL